jgi:cyclophilin family peptidyl-prolyl cis-trans isomerase
MPILGRWPLALIALLASPALLAAELPPKPTVSEIVQAAPAADWRTPDPENVLYMELPSGRVVIELSPTYAPAHVANIRTMVRDQYFDGLVVLRSHENYVAQWGDADEKNPRPFKNAKAKLPGEFSIPMKNDKAFVALREKDVYAPVVGHSNGFPTARNPKTGRAWMAHCYAIIGVGRDNAEDSGNGSSLYVVTGHAPRHLDQNLTMVGRVLQGMSHLTTLPRGTGPLGFYEKPEQNVPIKSVRVAADVPEAQRTRLEVMRTESATYQKVVDAARHRGGPWTKVSPGHVELCNAPIPVREQK